VTQLVLPLEVRSAQGRADFLVAPGNERAVAFIDSFPNWPAPAAALHGPAASGKSHLAAVWAQKAGAAVIDAADLNEAIQLASKIPPARVGSVEIRPTRELAP